MVTTRLLSTAEILSQSARFPGKIFPSSRLKSPQAIPVITVSVAMFGKQSVDHVGFEMFPIHGPWLQQNPLEVIQLRMVPMSDPLAKDLRRAFSG